MAPLRELGTPLFDMSGPTPFAAVQAGFDPLFPRSTLRAYWKSQYLDELSDAAIDVIADRARSRPAPLTLVNTLHMGGAIAAVDPEATAFAERAAPFMVSIDGMWTDPADDVARIGGDPLMRLWRRHHERDPLVCREFVELVTDYLDGALPDAQRARMDAHLAECDGCTGYLEDMRRLVGSLHQIPEPPPDPATRDALLRAFRDLRELP